MKSNLISKLFGIVAILLITFMVSCSDDNNRSNGKTVVMDVAPDLVSVGVRPPGYIGTVNVMKCTVEDTNQTLYINIGDIERFEYVNGFSYKLRVRITPIDNPPADGDTNRYELLEIISKQSIYDQYS
ncbi:MAG: DUF4377 domain-containing protein [Prevotella sp.]|nr:DUF4377 domain-containing protein [Prevotella sp.]